MLISFAFIFSLFKYIPYAFIKFFADTRPRLVAGSADGYSGHVDGKTREARMNHPKGLTVDDKGNIYIADTDNMAIRKISETGNSLVFTEVLQKNVLFASKPYEGNSCFFCCGP